VAPSTSRRGGAVLAGAALLGGALAGAIVFAVADVQPQQLDHRVAAGELPAVLDDLAKLVVQRLAVRGVDDLPDLGGRARNGMNRSQECSQVATVAG